MMEGWGIGWEEGEGKKGGEREGWEGEVGEKEEEGKGETHIWTQDS